MLQARVWLTTALALAIPVLATADSVRPVATFYLGKRGEWILPESGSGSFYVLEEGEGWRVEEISLEKKELLYTMSNDGKIACVKRHPLLKSLDFTPTCWDMGITRLDPADRPDPLMSSTAYSVYMASSLVPPGVYMPEEKHKHARRPEMAVGWALRLHNDTLYAPRQNAFRRGSVCWFLRTPEGFEVRDFTDTPQGELLASITRDRGVRFSPTFHRLLGSSGPAYWPFSTRNSRMAPLFEETHWNWLEDNPKLRYFPDGRVEGQEEVMTP